MLPAYTFKTKPYQHQEDYLKASWDKPAYALLSEMGTGKTKMLIDEVSMLYEADKIDTVVITSGKGNYTTWIGEVELHMPRTIDKMVYFWDGKDNMQTRQRGRDLLTSPGLRIFIVNIEALAVSNKARRYVRQLLSASNKRMIIVDESTLIKNHEAMRTREMMHLAKVSEYRRISTGNPTPNSPLDLWGQFEFLRGSGKNSPLLGYNSFYAFRARYCIMDTQHIGNGRTVQVPVSYRNLEELNQYVAQISYRVRKDQCLDLPPKIYQMRKVELTDEQKRIYDELKKVAVSVLDGSVGTISSTMVIGQLIKMHQVLCGQITDDDGVSHEIKSNRMEHLMEVLRESGQQTIIWSAYRLGLRSIVANLRKEFGPGCVVEYHGGVSAPDRELAIKQFQNGDAHFIALTPHAGSKGITLTAAKTVVYYSNTFNLEHRVQSEDRAHRIGQTSPVNYVDLNAGLLDDRIITALRAKLDVSSQIMGDGYRQWLV